MPTWSIGAIIAIIVLVLAIVLLVVGHTTLEIAYILIAGLALARLT
jgi:hypothetical protein